jgi:hypothetical protein
VCAGGKASGAGAGWGRSIRLPGMRGAGAYRGIDKVVGDSLDGCSSMVVGVERARPAL